MGDCRDFKHLLWGMKMSNRSVWVLEINIGFTNRLVLGLFMEKMFKQKTR